PMEPTANGSAVAQTPAPPLTAASAISRQDSSDNCEHWRTRPTAARRRIIGFCCQSSRGSPMRLALAFAAGAAIAAAASAFALPANQSVALQPGDSAYFE